MSGPDRKLKEVSTVHLIVARLFDGHDPWLIRRRVLVDGTSTESLFPGKPHPHIKYQPVDAVTVLLLL